jgi:hypothetical protein
MSAIAEPLVSQPARQIIFRSRREDLRLTKVQRYPIYGPGGMKVGEQPGQVVAFRDFTFACPPSGKVRLEDNREADAAEVIAWLESHPLIGNREEGFWRDEQPAPPVSQDEIDALMTATLDEEKLVAIIEQERAGWARDAILVPAQRSLEELRAMKAQIEADAQKASKRTAKE